MELYCIELQSIELNCVHLCRSTEDVRCPSLTTSAPHPDTATAKDSVDASDDLAPLNLSTRNSDKETFLCDKRLSSSEAEQSEGEDLPLNLSLRPSPQRSPEHHSSRTEPEDCRRSHELCEESCDQRQTAALALCQLATASSLKSPHNVSPEGEPPKAEEEEEDEETEGGRAAKSKTKANVAGVKRAKCSRADNNSNKLSKRAKTSGRPLRRRPRCS